MDSSNANPAEYAKEFISQIGIILYYNNAPDNRIPKLGGQQICKEGNFFIVIFAGPESLDETPIIDFIN